MSADAPILVVTMPLPPAELSGLLGAPFPDMVKFVVDVERGILAVAALRARIREVVFTQIGRGRPRP